jgi:MFS family permease
MLVRSATPKGATGRVFGFVYSGLDAGSALAPLLIGVILDHGNPIWVTWIVALAFFAAIFTAVSISTKAGSVLSPTGD